MSNMSPTPQAEVYSAGPMHGSHAAQVKEDKNVLGIIALITAVIGFIFACIPGALIVGWILLPISFILAIISLFMKGPKKFGGIALVVSILGTIVGFLVFFFAMANAVDEAFSDGEVTTSGSGADFVQEGNTAVGSEEAGDGDEGTRLNPYPIGTAISQGDWTVTVNSVTLDGTQEVIAENPFNSAPAEGNQYLLANVTATYNGDDQSGATPFASFEYVTAEGNTIPEYDTLVIAPDSFDSLSTLYPGASSTGNIVLEVPSDSAGEGTLTAQASLFGDRVFVAVQ